MKFALRSVLVFALVCGSAQAAGRTDAQVTPTEKVITLLNGMLEKGKQAKHDEAVQFSAYEKFCQDTSVEKERLINNAANSINKLTADIAKNQADAARLTKEIKDHGSDVAGWTADQEAATTIRNTEKTDYDVKHQDYSESIDALGRAIDVLKEQSYDRKQASFMQNADVLALKNLKLVPAEAERAIDAFLSQDPEEGLALSAPEANAYEFQSDHIIEILEKLLDEMVKERIQLETEEKNKLHAYEMMMQDLKKQIEQGETDIAEKTEFKAQANQHEADAKSDKTDTINAKEADQKYLADLTATCATKATNFASRQKLRAEEIVAIEKAIEILSSDSVAGAAEKHLPSMLQSKATALAQLRSDTQSNMQAHVSLYLQKRAKQLNSRLLSQVAQRAADEPFRKVIKMIKDLITKLLEDAAAEAEHKGWCDEELATNKQTREEHTASVESLTAQVDELEAHIAKLTEEIADLEAAVADLTEAMATATSIRQEEKAKNTQTIADAKEAAAATEKATEVLKLFYEKAAEATALVQQGDKEPEIFDGAYKGMQSENGGVVGMLEVILTDFERLRSDTETAETESQTEYDKFMLDSETDKSTKNADAEHKTRTKDSKTSALTMAKEDLTLEQEQLDKALAYYDKLKPSCVDAGVDFEDRAARREAEIQSLKEALEILNGKALR